MLKNNLITLIAHLFSILIIVVLMFSTNFGSLNPDIIMFIISIGILIFYMFIGTKLCLQKSKIMDLLSVSSAVWIGIFLWIIDCLTNWISLSYPGEIYSYYVSPVITLFFGFPEKFINIIKGVPIIQLSYSLIPSVFMWLGLEWKRKRGIKNP